MGAGNDEASGTALSVGGSWHARLVDGGGVLIPLNATEALVSELVDGGAYAFTGRLVADHRGAPREFVTVGARRIGAGGAA